MISSTLAQLLFLLVLFITTRTYVALKQTSSRRRFLLSGTTTGTSLVIIPAVGTANVIESIRQGASNIPGYGPSDIMYPPSLLGRWNVTRRTTYDTTTTMAVVSNYDVRFLPCQADTTFVVQDRGYNIMRFLNSSTNHPVRSYEWIQSNPNDVRLVFVDGSNMEIKVTKRASERPDNESVTSSEFQRITTEDAASLRGPSIQARRVLTKWKIVSDNVVEALELEYDMSGVTLNDPFITAAAGATKQAGPQLISKSRLHLERMS